MRRLLYLALATLLFHAAPLSAQETLAIQPEREGGELVLLVEKTGLLAGKQHRLLFPEYSGTVTYFRDKPTLSSVQFKADVNSLKVTDAWIKEQDRKKIYEYTLSDKMLDARQYPELSFVSREMAKIGEPARYQVDGTLSIRGKQKPVTVTVNIVDAGAGGVTVEGKCGFRLSDFDLKRPSAALGTIGTKDEVAVTFRMLAKRVSPMKLR